MAQEVRRSQRRRSHVDTFDPAKEASRPQLKSTNKKPRKSSMQKIKDDEILTPTRKRRSKSPKAMDSSQNMRNRSKDYRKKEENLIKHIKEEAKLSGTEAAEIADEHMKKQKYEHMNAQKIAPSPANNLRVDASPGVEFRSKGVTWNCLKLAISNLLLSVFAQNMAFLCWRARILGPVVLLMSIAFGGLVSTFCFFSQSYFHDLHLSVQSFNEFIAPPILAVNFLSKSGSEFQILESCLFASSIFVNLYLATKLYAPSRVHNVLLVFKVTSAILIFYSEWFSSLRSRYFGTVGVVTGLVGEFFCTNEDNRAEWLYLISAYALVLCASPFNFKRESLGFDDIIYSESEGGL